MNKKELKEIIKEDKAYYFDKGLKRVYRFFTHNPLYQRGRYIIICRKIGYYSLHQKSILGKILLAFYSRKKNILGEKIHIELGPNIFGRRLRIYHNDIVVNVGAIVGDDCELYGNNCIGNRGSNFPPTDAPILGNGVSLGVGANIIGKVHIAHNIKISSMSLVNKDLTEENALYGGVPAKLIKR
ncbi:MAG: hypothetical protein J5993_02260 [Clostridia bacterium]|nr:hypothetical protein [Clostridia bacterium]